MIDLDDGGRWNIVDKILVYSWYTFQNKRQYNFFIDVYISHNWGIIRRTQNCIFKDVHGLKVILNWRIHSKCVSHIIRIIFSQFFKLTFYYNEKKEPFERQDVILKHVKMLFLLRNSDGSALFQLEVPRKLKNDTWRHMNFFFSLSIMNMPNRNKFICHRSIFENFYFTELFLKWYGKPLICVYVMVN